MATKKATVRVDLHSAFDYGAHEMGSVLDMLRYCGFLDSNVKGFPKFIEYETGLSVSGDQIDRWKSFGYDAKLIVW